MLHKQCTGYLFLCSCKLPTFTTLECKAKERRLRCITFIFAFLYAFIWKACLITSLNWSNNFQPVRHSLSPFHHLSHYSLLHLCFHFMYYHYPKWIQIYLVLIYLLFYNYLIRMRKVNIQYPILWLILCSVYRSMFWG